MMKEKRIKIESKNSMMPILDGKVFHVTPTVNIPFIREAGAILPNINNQWDSLFGNAINGFFRLRGCVSFFDYREYGSKDWEEHAYKCTPGQIFRHTNTVSVLVLSERYYDKLESWRNWKVEEKWSQRVVPHVETGFPGAVKLQYLSEHLILNLQRDSLEYEESLASRYKV